MEKDLEIKLGNMVERIQILSQKLKMDEYRFLLDDNDVIDVINIIDYIFQAGSISDSSKVILKLSALFLEEKIKNFENENKDILIEKKRQSMWEKSLKSHADSVRKYDRILEENPGLRSYARSSLLD